MRLRTALAATAAIAVVAAAAPLGARGATVELLVESASAPTPLFAGTVTTAPHPVDGGDGSGPHGCDGPAGSSPSATATGALDDGLRTAGVSWRGNWDPSFRDFFIDRIGPHASAPPDSYWSLTVNDRFSPGGCLAKVVDGDRIHFFFGSLFGGPGQGPGEGGSPADAGTGPWAGNPPISMEIGPSAARLRRIAARAAAFLRDRGGVGEDWAALALAVRSGEAVDRAAAGLLDGRLAGQRPDGSIEGDVNATALSVLALRPRAPRRAARAAAWLVAAQAPGGGFGYRPGVAADVDTTGLATWALAVAGRRAAARSGAGFIRSGQALDGGFPPIAGGSSNAQTTGLAAVALRVTGIGAGHPLGPSRSSPLAYLTSLARRDGSIAYSRASSPTPVWSTAQALLGLTAGSKLLALGGRA